MGIVNLEELIEKHFRLIEDNINCLLMYDVGLEICENRSPKDLYEAIGENLNKLLSHLDECDTEKCKFDYSSLSKELSKIKNLVEKGVKVKNREIKGIKKLYEVYVRIIDLHIKFRKRY